MTHISQQNRILPHVYGETALTIQIDGIPVTAYAGQTVAAVLLAAGRRILRYTDKMHSPRGIYCGMGICFDCLVKVDGVADIRACMTPVREGMVIETGEVSHE